MRHSQHSRTRKDPTQEVGMGGGCWGESFNAEVISNQIWLNCILTTTSTCTVVICASSPDAETLSVASFQRGRTHSHTAMNSWFYGEWSAEKRSINLHSPVVTASKSGLSDTLNRLHHLVSAAHLCLSDSRCTRSGTYFSSLFRCSLCWSNLSSLYVSCFLLIKVWSQNI